MRNRVSQTSLTRQAFVFGLWLTVASLPGTRLMAKEEVTTKSFPQPAYNGISIRFPADFEIRLAGKDSLTVTAEPKVLSALRFVVKDEVLVLSADTFQTSKPIKVRVDTSRLKSLQVSSSANIRMPDIATGRLTIESSASADMTISGLSTEHLKLTVSGSESIKLAGRTKVFELNAEGSSDIDARKLEAQSVVATVSGASTAWVNSIADLRATASDSATIKYLGGGRITKRVSDAAEVARAQ